MATVAELEKLLQRKQDLDALKSQFFANVSHELRTPLALILGPVEKLLADSPNLDERERRDLEVVRRNAWLLLRHVNDLLDVSKLDAGKLALRYAAIDLGQLVRRVAGHFETLAPQRNITYTVDVPAHLAAEVDAEKLERVVLNLLSNAFKFVPAGGHVKLALHRAEDRALLSVEDDGPGVPAELRELIFERFAQGDGGTTRQFGGTGLGLAIAKEFVAQHRGTIVVTNGAKSGAVFVVDIPLTAPSGTVLAEARTGDPELAESVVEPLRPAGVPRRVDARDARPLVVVVEDNVEMNRFIQESLEPGCSVATAFDGREGLQQIMAAAPDLVVTDMMMPNVSGEELLEHVRARPELDGVPVLVLSAKADDATRVRLLQQGAQDYLVKPFSAEELRARAGNLIMMNRARVVLQRELDSQQQDLERLAEDATARNRELSVALEAMRQAREAATAASAVKSEFLSLVSHELRTPLMTIQLQLDRIDRANKQAHDAAEPSDGKQQAQMAKLRLSAQRLLELVDSLLEYTRLDSNRIEIRPQRFCLPTLVEETVDEMRPRAERKQIELHVRTELSPTFVSDPRLIRLIMLNLVDNAIKFTERGGVELFVESQPDHIVLTVRDSGRGIPDEQQRMIFEPWGRVETVREKHTPGVGLGLTLVKRMTESLGGRIELSSKLGEGSAFRLHIPEAPDDLASPP